MRACCCWSTYCCWRRSYGTCCRASLTLRITEAADPANWPDEPEVTVDDPTLLRHVRENDWPPGISAYDVMR